MLTKNPKVDLKLKHQRIFEVGMILSILLVIFAFRFFPEVKSQTHIQKIENEFITVEDVLITNGIKTPPLPQIPIIPIEIPEDEELIDIEIENTDLIHTANVSDAKNYREEIEKIDEQPPFIWVEEMPEIIGGLQSLQSKIIYPEIAQKAGIGGKVILQATIDKIGNPIDIIVLKAVGAGCDEAAIEALKSVKFTPGKQRGKPVYVRITIPIVFALQ
ncbi:MAG: energy transducer TonB [Ignavibacteriae bacterium]|nr:energy transducer TonB [Ignavibacteriota bacterium]